MSSIDSSPGKVSLAPLTPTSNPRSGNLFEWGIRKDPPLGLPGAVNLHRDLVLYWTKGTAGCAMVTMTDDDHIGSRAELSNCTLI